MDAKSTRQLLIGLCVVAVVIGSFLRIGRWENFKHLGFDEAYYVKYTNWHASHSLSELPELNAQFHAEQMASAVGLPSPFRIFYPYTAMLLMKASSLSARDALVVCSVVWCLILLLASALFSMKLFGPGTAAGVTALLAVSFNQLHQSQRILIDCVIGALAIVALYSIWEIAHGKRPKLFWFLYVASMFAVIFVKESAFFIYVGIGATIVLGRPLGIFQKQPRYLLAVTFATGAVAFSLLCLSAGGFEKFFEIYMAVVEKSLKTPYVIMFGDGPWYRYIVDSFLAQPLISLLAIGGLMHLPFSDSRVRYLCLFMAATFALMCQVKYGQFFRYSIIWDLALRVLAFLQLAALCKRFAPQRWPLAAAIVTFMVCLHEFSVYWKVCVLRRSYALETYELMVNLDFYRPSLPNK